MINTDNDAFEIGAYPHTGQPTAAEIHIENAGADGEAREAITAKIPGYPIIVINIIVETGAAFPDICSQRRTPGFCAVFIIAMHPDGAHDRIGQRDCSQTNFYLAGGLYVIPLGQHDAHDGNCDNTEPHDDIDDGETGAATVLHRPNPFQR